MWRTAIILLFAAACSPGVPHSQFGPYVAGSEKHIRVKGDSVVVYRVKYWTFDSGDQPALQLEYAALDSLRDTSALTLRARQLWPVFSPYVEALGLNSAIITATRLERSGGIGLWRVSTEHFGLIADRDSAGVWRFINDTTPLPPADYSRPQIIEANGQPMDPSRVPPSIR
jgi:hypothetical protein